MFGGAGLARISGGTGSYGRVMQAVRGNEHAERMQSCQELQTPWKTFKARHRAGAYSALTIMMMIISPAMTRFTRFCLGKYGSSAPVIGFSIVMGAMAVNWGRGRS